jgi:NAD(P)H-hydrate epimerase
VTDPGGAWLDEAIAAALLPERDPRGHKGTFGRVIAVAGSLDYAGAALMAGAAALRAGSGMVTVCVPASLQPLIAGRIPELITHGLPEVEPFEVDAAASAADIGERACDALLVGPGLRPGRGTERLTRRLLAAEGSVAVVDAGALEALSRAPGWWTRLARRVIITPHPGEMARLGRPVGPSDEERRALAEAAAVEWGVTVVLKGANTVVADPGGSSLAAPFEVPGLATAGSGDILAGVIASLAGQGLAPFDAAALGVYLHARAGRDVGARMGGAGLMATDLLSAIPRERDYLEHERWRAGRVGFDAPLDEAT